MPARCHAGWRGGMPRKLVADRGQQGREAALQENGSRPRAALPPQTGKQIMRGLPEWRRCGGADHDSLSHGLRVRAARQAGSGHGMAGTRAKRSGPARWQQMGGCKPTFGQGRRARLHGPETLDLGWRARSGRPHINFCCDFARLNMMKAFSCMRACNAVARSHPVPPPDPGGGRIHTIRQRKF